MERILGLSIAKVLKWGSFLCGFSFNYLINF